MKKFELFALFFIIIASSIAATYTGTKPSDLNLSTPTEGNTKVSEFNNSDREIKTVIVNLENTTVVTGTYTVAGTQTGILGSSTTAFTISFPAASTLATGTITKRYMIKNINSGTITLNLTVDGVGSPTVTGSQTFKLFTDGTSWFEDRVGRAAVASNADLLDNLDSTYFTNASNLATGTVALARIPGTLTGKSADLLDEQTGSYYTNASNLDSGSIPLARIPTTLTGKDADTIDTINGASIVQTSRTISTTAPLAGGSDLSANLTLSIPLATSGQNGYISSADWSTFNNKLSTSRTITTTSPLTIAGVSSADLSADRTIAMATATASQDGFLKKEDFQTFNNKANITAGSGITSSSSAGTTTITNNGVLQILAGSGISITGNGTGTPTITASGTSSAGGWTDTGTTTTATAGLRVVAQGTIAVHADYGITGLTDAWLPDNLTVASFTNITTRNYDDITGTSTIRPTQMAMGTTTYQGALNAVGSATFSGTVTASNFSGSAAGLTGISLAFSAVTGLPTGNQYVAEVSGTATIPIRDASGNLHLNGIFVLGTTTTPSVGSYTVIYNKISTKSDLANSIVDPTSEYGTTASTKLLLHCNNAGSTTFTDSSTFAHAITVSGNAIGTSAARFGGGSAWFDGTSDFLIVATSSAFAFGTGSFRFDASVYFNTLPAFSIIYANRSTNKMIIDYKSGTSELRALLDTSTPLVTWNPNTKTWYDLSIIRYDGSISFHIDGAQVGSTQADSSNISGQTSPYIGGDPIDARWFDGLIDEIRVGSDTINIAETVNYTSNAFQIIPTGTSSSFLNIADDGTKSNKVEMVLGSTTPFSSATVHILQGITASRTLFGFYDSYCFEASKDIFGTGTSVQNEAYAIAKKVNIVKSHPVDPRKKVTQEKAKVATQEDYMNLFKKSDIETYKSDHIAEYTTIIAGTVSVNLTKLDSDAQSYHEIQRKAEFEVLPDLSERIQAKKKTMESDKSIISISIIADDQSTDDLLKGADNRTASMGNQIGVLFGAFQKQTEEIGSLTAALENQKIAYNEEVDNLYKLVNAIIVALLAVGGVSGWSTIRRKRKGT